MATKTQKRITRSDCCGAEVVASLSDGVLVGSCAKCGRAVCRYNPHTEATEMLRGRSPWRPFKGGEPSRG